MNFLPSKKKFLCDFFFLIPVETFKLDPKSMDFTVNKKIIFICIRWLCDVDAKNDDGQTPLHSAVKEGKIDIVKFLVENNAMIDANDNERVTPFQLAMAGGKLEVAHFLLQNGANIDARNSVDKTSLHLAASEGNIESVKFLVDNGAMIDAKENDSMTPFCCAVLSEKFDVAQFLIQSGANIDAKNAIDGLNLLHHSAANGKFETAKFLVENGAMVDPKTNDDQTPLHYAASNGWLEVVKFLVEKGAMIDARDKDDRTPLYLGYEYDKDCIINYLTNMKKRKAETEIPEENYNNKDPCVICYEPRNGFFVLLPCGHTSLCEFCCFKISTKRNNSKCPSCRKAVNSFKKIFYEQVQRS